MDTKQGSAHKVNSGEEKSPNAPARDWTHDLYIMKLWLYQLIYPNPLNAIDKATTQRPADIYAIETELLLI